MRSIRKSGLRWCLVLLLGLGLVAFLSGCDSDDDVEEHTHPAVEHTHDGVPEHTHPAVEHTHDGVAGEEHTHDLPDHDHATDMPALPTPMPPSEALKRQVVEANAMIAYEGYKAAHAAMTHFQEDLMYFDMDPPGELEHMQESWLAAREVYQPTEVYRFRLGPIDTLRDDGTIGEDGDGPELRINGWPLGEAFIDYTYCGPTDGGIDSGRDDIDEGDREASCAAQDVNLGGIIHDTNAVPTIDVDTLKTDLAAMTADEFDIATGYHALEFLLWGQDLNYFDQKAGRWGAGTEPGYRDWTSGDRPGSDFASRAEFGTCTSGPIEHDDHTVCQRRVDYLMAATELLIQDLENVMNAWDPAGSGNYYDMFTDPANTDQSLAKILEGMGRMAFGELAGERINIARVTGDQEEEHSCFSDNTHRDIYLNVVGIQNMYLGDYDPLSTQDYEEHRLGIFTSVYTGPGIYDLLMSADPGLAYELKMSIEEALAEAAEIDALAKGAKPFDVQIAQGTPAVRQIIVELVDVTENIARAITALGLDDLITEGGLEQDTEEDIDNVS